MGMKLIDKKDSRYFTETSKEPYIRHRYKVVDIHGKCVIFDNWETAQLTWFQSGAFLSHIEVLDKKVEKKTKGFK
jgi:hypothetical protein